MCFGGGGNKPEQPKIPEPSPSPSPSPSEAAPMTADQRRTRLAMARQGMLSTIKTSPQGVSGARADLYSSDPTKKKALGA